MPNRQVQVGANLNKTPLRSLGGVQASCFVEDFTSTLPGSQS